MNRGTINLLLLALSAGLLTLVAGAELATNPGAWDRLEDGLTRIDEPMLLRLEQMLRQAEASVEMPREFTVPGADRLSAALELARTVVRRAERRVIALDREPVETLWSIDANDYCVRSPGTETDIDTAWHEDLPDPEWVYFGDRAVDRVIFFVHHEDDSHGDQFWQMQGNMTVFGFGRKPHENPGTYMDQVPVHMTIGFAESRDFNEISNTIRKAIQEPVIETGKIQKLVL